MKSLVSLLVASATTLLIIGCQQTPAPPKGPSGDADYYTWSVDPGVSYKLPIPADHENGDYKASRARLDKLIETNKKKSPTDPPGADGLTDIKWVVPGINFEVMNSKIKLNSKAYGTVKQGDKVRVGSDGKVMVNDQPRQSE